MAKKGSLNKKSFFPSVGDLLENPSDGILWECVRNNSFITRQGEKLRYGLLLGTSPEFEGTARIAIHDSDGKFWLDDIQTVKRPLPVAEGQEPTYKKYVWNPATLTWQEE